MAIRKKLFGQESTVRNFKSDGNIIFRGYVKAESADEAKLAFEKYMYDVMGIRWTKLTGDKIYVDDAGFGDFDVIYVMSARAIKNW